MGIKMRADLIQNGIMYLRRFHQNFMLARINHNQCAVGPGRHAFLDPGYIHNLFVAAKKAKAGLWGAGHMRQLPGFVQRAVKPPQAGPAEL